MTTRTKVDLLTVSASGEAESLEARISGDAPESVGATFPEAFAASGTPSNCTSRAAVIRVDPSD